MLVWPGWAPPRAAAAGEAVGGQPLQLLPPNLPTCAVPSLDSAYGRPLNRSAPLCCGFPPKVLGSAIPTGSGSTEVIVKVRTCASTRRCCSLKSSALGASSSSSSPRPRGLLCTSSWLSQRLVLMAFVAEIHNFSNYHNTETSQDLSI